MASEVSIDEWIGRIRSPDPMTFENAYFGARPSGPEVIPVLVAELHRATDAYMRGKFCELLGEMGDASVVPVLVQELLHPDERVRNWAACAIEELNSPDIRSEKLKHLAQFRVGDAQ